METMINLTDLLKHEILDLYSVEEQIIEALPKMVEKAKNPELKKTLQQHLKITEEQKSRLDKVKQTFGEGDGENKGFFSRLFGGGSGGEKCKGMEGIIGEGKKILDADITDEAMDAAIIASAQKIEHYEICGYGTARAFARELRLQEVERLLTQTLNEEYEADDKLTALAVGKLNVEAEHADGMESGDKGAGRSSRGSNGTSSSSSPGKNSSKGGSSKGSSKSSAKGGGFKSSSKGSSKSSASGSSSNGASKNSSKGSSKSSAKGGSSKSGNKGSSKGSSKKAGSRSTATISSSKSGSKGKSKSGRR